MEPMAFKRSAVRSRLSPPKVLVFFENQDFFLSFSLFRWIFFRALTVLPLYSRNS